MHNNVIVFTACTVRVILQVRLAWHSYVPLSCKTGATSSGFAAAPKHEAKSCWTLPCPMSCPCAAPWLMDAKMVKMAITHQSIIQSFVMPKWLAPFISEWQKINLDQCPEHPIHDRIRGADPCPLMAGDLQGPRMNSWKSGAVFITAYCPLMVLPSAINVFPFTVQLGHLQ